MQQVVVDGVRLRIEHAVVDQHRLTLVFLHDSLGSIELWRDFPAKLANACSCNLLIYDRQGHGESAPLGLTARTSDYLEREADLLHDLLQQLDIQQAILFGHSDGGSIALIAASKYPSRIKGVISEAAHIFVEEITLQGIRAAVHSYEHTALKRRLEMYHGEKTEAIFRAWAGTWLKEEYRSWNIEHFLPGIQCPVLVIQGEKDEYGSEAQVDGVIDAVSGTVQKLMIPGIGHTPHKEAPDAVLRATASFILGLAGP
jgi:pimeloyl-ACP methyl ester carboxylesterase